MYLNEDKELSKSELNDLQKRYVDLFDLSPVGLFILGETGVILKVNPMGAKLLGIEKVNLLEKSFLRYLAPEFHHQFLQYLKSYDQDKMLKTSWLKILQRDKPIMYAEIIGRPNVNVSTGKIEWLIIIVSVSPHKPSEPEEEKNSKEASQPFSYSLVNYLNQPLAVIANYIYGCIHRLESGNYKMQTLLQAMQQAEHELHRIAEIILRMKNFSCKEVFKFELNCINSLMKEIIEFVNHEIIDFPVSINYRQIKDLPKINLDKIYIQYAILNVARNAIEAMKEAKVDDPKLIIEVNRPKKNKVEIRLMDNGPGVDLPTAHKLFDPTFTTKSYGIGLGLAISRNIVESHGGSLQVELNPTHGSCFTIGLPLAVT